MKMEITVKVVSWHRNGVCGEGFYAVLFDWQDDDLLRHMVGTLFDKEGQCAVYDVSELDAGNIAFARGNSWRGDHFETALREAIKKSSTGRIGPFAAIPTDVLNSVISDHLSKRKKTP